MKGGRSTLSIFEKILKIALILEKNTLIVFLYGLSFSFKMLVKSNLEKKTPKIFFVVPFFHALWCKCLSKCYYSKKPPLPWKTFGCVPIFEITKLDFVKFEFLAQTVNFGIGCGFSEVLGPGQYPLYKVCQFYYERLRFLWWQVELFLITGQDFHDEISRFYYEQLRFS